MNYIKICGVEFTIDLDAMTGLVTINSDDKEKCLSESTTIENFDSENKLIGRTVTTNTYNNEKQVDTTRYDVIRTMLDIILMYDSVLDDKLGYLRAFEELPINVKIAMNTLLKYKILIKK